MAVSRFARSTAASWVASPAFLILVFAGAGRAGAGPTPPAAKPAEDQKDPKKDEKKDEAPKKPEAAPPARANMHFVEGLGEIELPLPPLTDGIFPCTQCHEKGAPFDHSRRELNFHDEIKLEHDAEHRWCLDCHNAEDRDKLHLASGQTIEFTESYKLCGQCHGDKYRDWRAGVHGRRSGYWDGPKKYLLCVNCHWPHAPHFKPLKPEPPPRRPEENK